MIRLATIEDEAQVLAVLSRYPALGASAEVDWRLWRQNPAMPYRFYLLNKAAVLEYGPTCPVLCGDVEDEEELESLLALECLCRLESTGWAPEGWMRQPHTVMKRPPAKGPPAKGPHAPAPHGFVENPPPGEVMTVLESRKPYVPPVARDSFYTRLCTRVNHGHADVVGIRNEAGTLVCTAGLYALRTGEGYLGAVETAPGYEGRGYATALIEQLAARHPARAITLICEPPLEAFYKRMGFAPTGGKTCIANKPNET